MSFNALQSVLIVSIRVLMCVCMYSLSLYVRCTGECDCVKLDLTTRQITVGTASYNSDHHT